MAESSDPEREKMKKRAVKYLTVLFAAFLCLTAAPTWANAEEDGIKIVLQPQNLVFTEYGDAAWSVEAEGENLVYDWFITFRGVTYDTAKAEAENQPWLPYVTGGCGRKDGGSLIFMYGIEKELNGAEIFCRISGNGSEVYSSKAIIYIGSKTDPAQIRVPASVTADIGNEVKLTCEVGIPDGDAVESYLWCETKTGKLDDMTAIGFSEGYAENKPTLICDTSEPGTRWYVCTVGTVKGGISYSSVIPVTVRDPNGAGTESSGALSSEIPDSSGTPGSSGTPQTSGSIRQTSKTESPEKTPADASEGISVTSAALIALAALFIGAGAVITALIITKSKKQ